MFFFFFSSRRRHTRLQGDWSSDVCSSDLRAIENQCYVLAAGQIGDHEPHRTCYGRSMIIDPWGTVLAQAPDVIGVTVADLDFGRLSTIRTQLPSLANRRLSH